jgi:Cu+-exporting ATPase
MGTPFYISAFKSLKHRSANMDVLVSMGTSAAWLYGIALLFVGYDYEDMHNTLMYRMQVMEHAHNFEISSALITIILLGKYIEQFSKKKTLDKLSQLASLKVTKANLVEDPSKGVAAPHREIDVELVEKGDVIKVIPGQGIPVDGIVLIGKGLCNESMLTGESKPLSKDVGSKVFGGALLI